MPAPKVTPAKKKKRSQRSEILISSSFKTIIEKKEKKGILPQKQNQRKLSKLNLRSKD